MRFRAICHFRNNHRIILFHTSISVLIILTTVLLLKNSSHILHDSLAVRAERFAGIIKAGIAAEPSTDGIGSLKTIIDAHRHIEEVSIKDTSGLINFNYKSPHAGRKSSAVKSPFASGFIEGSVIVRAGNYPELQQAQTFADKIADIVSPHVWNYNTSAMSSLLDAFFGYYQLSYLELSDSRGKTLFAKGQLHAASSAQARHDIAKDGLKIASIHLALSEAGASAEESFFVPFTVVASLAALLLLNLLLNLVLKRFLPARASLKHIPNDILKKIRLVEEYINSNFTEDMPADKLTEIAGLNRDTIGRYFHLYSGVKLTNYINRLRAARALEMIKTSDLNILEIAMRCGFNSPGTFNRVFKDIYKRTPASFRP